MDAGSVLNALLARHDSYLSDAAAAAGSSHTRGRGRGDSSSSSTRGPPAKVVEAVRRGVNPLMLGANMHPAEAAARQQAKRKRATRAPLPRVKALRVLQAGAVGEEAPSTLNKMPRTQGKGKTQKDEKAAKKAPAVSLSLSSRQVDQARGEAVSKTLAARHRELRAQQQEEEEARKRGRSTSSTREATRNKLSSSSSRDADGRDSAAQARARLETSASLPASPLSQNEKKTFGAAALPAKTRRDVWRRRCTTQKILRLTRGVSRAVAVRRYWYTRLGEGVANAPSTRGAAPSAADTKKKVTSAAVKTPTLDTQECTSSQQGVQDAVEAACAGRRFRAARRGVLADFHARVKARRVAAAAKAPRAGEDSAVRLTRRRYKAGVHDAEVHAAASMWALAARVVVERREVIGRLTTSCADAAAVEGAKKDGVLPLLLARHFPLFGAFVEVQELEVQVARLSCRRTRHHRRARYAASGEDDTHGKEKKAAALSATRLCVLQRHTGVVVEDYSDSVGVLLLPLSLLTSDAGKSAWAAALEQERVSRTGGSNDAAYRCALQHLQTLASTPRVVRVPKHFPGATGAFTELLPLVLARTRGGWSAKAGRAFTPAHSVSATSTHTRVLVAVFSGEVDHGGNAGNDASAHAYPLKRLLHRCL